jgi:glyoxylase-like metal-dependent hydrolase (beta-lactamase superfamily II)
MFGVVPKSLWQRTNPADENNLCTWAMRCLLIEDGDQLILIDNGIGNKQDVKFFAHYYLHGDDSLEKSLRQLGFDFTDITDVFLTHLHFDHCGGGVKYTPDRTKFELTFPNARYWTNFDHYQWATQPNAREKASFLKENILPMAESGHLHFINPESPSPFSQFDIWYADGHTEKMMLPVIPYQDTKLIYVADLLPSQSHIALPYIMSYDTRPLLTMQEKEKLLNQAAADKFILFFEHDPYQECCTVKLTEKGVRIDEAFTLASFI